LIWKNEIMLPLLAEMDTNTMYLGVATVFCSALTTVAGGYIAYKTGQLKKNQDDVKQTLLESNAIHDAKLKEAATAVENVKTILKETTAIQENKLASIAESSDLAQKLADGVMTAQLLVNRDALRRVADLTGRVGDVAAWKAAEQVYENHAAQHRNSEQEGK